MDSDNIIEIIRESIRFHQSSKGFRKHTLIYFIM